VAGSLDHILSTGDRTAFIQHRAHTDRYVFDFLADEVLKRQEAATRASLLETSILPELTPALCNALTGRRDAQTVLEVLYPVGMKKLTCSYPATSGKIGLK